MEEILASIRSIIAEEREPAKAEPAKPAPNRPAARRRTADRLFQGWARAPNSAGSGARSLNLARSPKPIRPKVVWRRLSLRLQNSAENAKSAR